MKTTCYLRIAQTDSGKVIFNATSEFSSDRLIDSRGYSFDTRVIKLNLKLPDDMFGPDAEVAVDVPSSAIKAPGGLMGFVGNPRVIATVEE